MTVTTGILAALYWKIGWRAALLWGALGLAVWAVVGLAVWAITR